MFLQPRPWSSCTVPFQHKPRGCMCCLSVHSNKHGLKILFVLSRGGLLVLFCCCFHSVPIRVVCLFERNSGLGFLLETNNMHSLFGGAISHSVRPRNHVSFVAYTSFKSKRGTRSAGYPLQNMLHRARRISGCKLRLNWTECWYYPSVYPKL